MVGNGVDCAVGVDATAGMQSSRVGREHHSGCTGDGGGGT